MRVNYNKIIEDVALETNHDVEEVKVIINGFIGKIKSYISRGFEVNILSFCKFKKGEASSRNMYDFQEKSIKPMPKRMIPKCEFVRKFKKEINEQA